MRVKLRRYTLREHVTCATMAVCGLARLAFQLFSAVPAAGYRTPAHGSERSTEIRMEIVGDRARVAASRAQPTLRSGLGRAGKIQSATFDRDCGLFKVRYYGTPATTSALLL